MIVGKQLCVDIGSSKIKIAYGTTFVRRAKVHLARTIDTPMGTVANGYITDTNAVASVIREWLSINKIKNPHSSFVLNSNQIIYRTITLPGLPIKAKYQAIVWDLERIVKGTVAEYYLSWKQGKIKDRVQQISYMAVPRKLVDQFGEISDQVGLRLTAVESASFCLTRIHADTQGNFIILDLGNEGARISYCEDGDLKACRMLNYTTTEKNHNVNELMRYLLLTITYFSTSDKTVRKVILVGGMANDECIREKLKERNIGYESLDQRLPARLQSKDILKNPELYASTFGLLLRA